MTASPPGASAVHLGPQKLAILATVTVFVVLHGVWFTRLPTDLDAFNFVLGVRSFDVTQHRPHPPGAPVFVAIGKTAAWAWSALGLPADSLAGHEPAGLTALSLIAGGFSIVCVWRIMRELSCPPSRALLTTLLVGSAPLLWILAARRVSDASGLAAVLAVCWLTIRGQLREASVLAGLVVGLRVQTLLLTGPPLLLRLMQRRSWRTVAAAAGWFAIGVAAWLLPLIGAAGGVDRYWASVTQQTGEDLSSPIIVAATPTLRNVTDAVFNTFVRPWGSPGSALAVSLPAIAGVIRLRRTAAHRAQTLLFCATPYVLFHLTFHETATVRYALPLVLAIAYLAAVGLEGLPRRVQFTLAALLIGSNLVVSVRALKAYSRDDPPAMALLKAMYRRATDLPPAFVTAHSEIMLPRLQEILTQPVPWRLVIPPDSYEWMTTVNHWREGGVTPLWFVAEPRRTDLSLIDRRSRHLLESFRLNARTGWVLHGVRPGALSWWELRQPAWVAMQGFALTPEVGGVTARDAHGPSLGGAAAIIRRSNIGGVLVVGGRHVGQAGDPPVRIAIDIDGREVKGVSVSPEARHYAALIHLSPGQLQGEGPYATVIIRSTALVATEKPVPVTVEQFDYQPDTGTLFAFAAGWHEPELEPRSGETWRWASRQATLLIHRPHGTAVALDFSGGVPRHRRVVSSRIEVSAAGRVVDAFIPGSSRFSRRIDVPVDAETCDIQITFDSNAALVPLALKQSADARELAFRAFDLELVEVTRQ
jgi:hypothetical protein